MNNSLYVYDYSFHNVLNKVYGSCLVLPFYNAPGKKIVYVRYGFLTLKADVKEQMLTTNML